MHFSSPVWQSFSTRAAIFLVEYGSSFDQLIPIQQLAILKDRGVYSSIYRVLDSRWLQSAAADKSRRHC